ncbi:COG4223 family protein [Rhodovulum adriaticum]|uniref:Inner membrane protein n=1 Tax=Rhodovulum adriaticum TaxID=35804 RepID=A0A4R2NZ66_RHOAD|nr:mitofilin family membrane protein [Rhodovulum adriaticum]MBK1634850.1 hypothetical protein [Rhodovulum adriaticum]TCP27570.1 hypothetical protein EV656_101478 [Rhodovulum adriaticum]
MANTEDEKITESSTDLPQGDTAEEPRAQDDTPGDVTEETPVEDAEIVEETAEEATDETPKAQPEQDKASHPAPRRKGGLLMPLIGGVLAAGVGYGAANYIKPEGWPFPGTADPAAGQELATLADRLSALEGRVAELPTGASAVEMPDLSGFEARIDALAEQVAGLESALEEVQITGGGDEAAAALTAYQEEIEAMRAELASQREENTRLADSVAAVADESEAEIAAAMDRAAAVEARAAMMRIDAALASGAPFAPALDQLGDAEVPAALADIAAQGVPTLAQLQSDYPPAARAALDAALEEQADGDVANRMTAFLRSQLGMRSLSPREGDDADAVLSRAEAALRAGDLAAALDELNALPDAARAEMAGWVADATARAEAVAAAAALEQTLNSN